jgi:hypothetical protein
VKFLQLKVNKPILYCWRENSRKVERNWNIWSSNHSILVPRGLFHYPTQTSERGWPYHSQTNKFEIKQREISIAVYWGSILNSQLLLTISKIWPKLYINIEINRISQLNQNLACFFLLKVKSEQGLYPSRILFGLWCTSMFFAWLFHSMHFNATLSIHAVIAHMVKSSIVIGCCQIWHTITSCEQPQPIWMFCTISYRAHVSHYKYIISTPITRLEWLLNNYVSNWHRGFRLQKRGI